MQQPSGTPPTPPNDVAPRRRGSSWRSVERQLPLLMSIVLVVTVASFLVVTYATLAESARERAVDRVRVAAQRLAVDAETGVRNLGTRIETAGRDPALRRVLTASDPRAASLAHDLEATRAALSRLLPNNDTTVAVELWTADGRRVAHVGRDVLATELREGDAERRGLSLPSRGLDGLVPSDSVQLGRLYGEDRQVYFWAVAPVMVDGAPAGYIARQARLSPNERASELLRALSGSDVRAYYRNVDDDFWTTLGADVVEAPADRDRVGDDLVAMRAGVGRVLLVEDRIGETSLMLAFELPLASVLAGPRATIVRLALLSTLLMVFGAAAAWGISRRFTRPLAALTSAAESMADGRYDARVTPAQEEELARLAASFNRMAERVGSAQRELERQTATALQAHADADAASRAKSQFLTVMSHELRTPLNAIGGYAELMELGLRGPITDEQRRDLVRIRASQQHLLGLISGVLDLSRIESGRVSYQVAPVLLDPFLAGIDALVEPQAAAKTLTLEYEPGDPSLAVMADHEKLRQILLNLLSNAIRFTPRGGRITLTAMPEPRGMVAIRVEDTGIGIAEEALEQVFEPFVQLDRTLTNPRDGIGLGLSISRDLARGMGGDLTAESRVGRGSRFTLTLPQAAVESGTIAPLFSGEFPAPAHGADSPR